MLLVASAGGTFGAIIVVLVIVGALIVGAKQGQAQNAKAKQMVCPHCHTKGTVTVRSVRVKKGISGGKATGAVLTGGLSILATGLSRKEGHLKAKCSNCGVTWLI